MKVRVKIKRLSEHAVIPQYAHEYDAGFDLVASEDVIIEPGETSLVPTGLAFELPPNYELQIRPRSGISLKTKLRVANAPGTVDSNYRGEVKVIVDNIAKPITVIDGLTHRAALERRIVVNRGDRIAQGVIKPVERASFVVVDELTETARGEGGFGSSGIKAKEAK